MKRRGTSLLELLTTLVVMTALLIAVTPAMRSLIGEIPKGRELLESHTVLDRALERLGRDVDAATSVSGPAEGQEAEEAGPLLVALPDGVVRYEFDGERIIRRPADGPGAEDDAMVWHAPLANVKWRLWRRDGRVFAVEVRAWYELATGEVVARKLHQGHVFFVGAARAAVHTSTAEKGKSGAQNEKTIRPYELFFHFAPATTTDAEEVLITPNDRSDEYFVPLTCLFRPDGRQRIPAPKGQVGS